MIQIRVCTAAAAVLLCITQVTCFVSQQRQLPTSTLRSAQRQLSMSAESDRRNFLSTSLLGVVGILLPEAAKASVYIEIDRYGDKELRLGTVSKLRQQLRNRMLEDPSLAPGLLKLAINDALGYNAKTQTGGPDGSVKYEMDRAENDGLKEALSCCENIFSVMKRTSEITLSDVVAFGGGEAIQACGGPRIVVQLGRYDTKKGANPADPIPGYSFTSPTGDGIKAAFKRSGLGSREASVLLAALGTITAITEQAIRDKGDGDEEDDLVDSSWEKNLPNSFGGQSEIYGEKIGKGNFDTTYIDGILSKKAAAGGPLDTVLMKDEELTTFLRKYNKNNKAFTTDLSEAYGRLTLLGELYENRIQARD